MQQNTEGKIIKEYWETKEYKEYKEKMKKLLNKKGIFLAVEQYLGEICCVLDTSFIGYQERKTIKGYIDNITTLLALNESEGE